MIPGKSRSIPKKSVLIAFGIVVLGAVASLPWQASQWKQLSKTREEREANERRLTALENQKKGERETTEQIESNPDSPEAQLGRIRLLLDKQQIPGALDALVAFESRFAASPAAWRPLSDLYKEVGYTDKALNYARKCVEQEPNSSLALTQLAFIELTLGWRTEALAHIQAAIRNSPDAPDPLLAMALLHHREGEEAVKYAQKAYTLQPENWRIISVLARDLANIGKYAEAQALLEKAEKLTPGEPQIYLYKADIAWDQRANAKLSATENAALLKQARANAQRALDMAPYDASPCFLLGQIAEEDGDIPTAIANYEKDYAQNPTNVQGEYRYAQLLIRNGATPELKSKGKAILAKHLENTAEAEKFNKVVLSATRQRTAPEPHRALARYCETTKRLPRAILEWEEVARLDPKATDAREAIVRLKKLRGDILVENP